MKKYFVLLTVLLICLMCTVSVFGANSNLWRIEAEQTAVNSNGVYINTAGDATLYASGVGIDSRESYVLYYEHIPASCGITIGYASPHQGAVSFAYAEDEQWVNAGSISFTSTDDWSFVSGVQEASVTGISIPGNATLRVTANAPINLDYITFHMHSPKAMEGTRLLIVPQPMMIHHAGMLGDEYVAACFPATIQTFNKELQGAVDAFCVYAKRLHGISFTKGDAITVLLDENLEPRMYRIDCTDIGITVRAKDEQGISAAMSTLVQGIHSHAVGFKFQKGLIIDRPQAEHRGIMIDIARKHHPVDYLYRYVDICYMNKLNALQLHLSDTEGYRVPSKAYPFITSTDGAYTYDEIKGLVKYAKDRGVELIPEIDIPGHCARMQATYPEVFGYTGVICAEEHAFQAVNTLLSEIAEMFCYSTYIHVGGDEAAYTAWANCEGCKAAMAGYGCTDYGQLYAYFVGRCAQMVLDLGRKPIVWEGFHAENNRFIPKETIINVFECYYQTPESLLDYGFSVINCAWNPHYIVVPGTYWSFAEVYAASKNFFNAIYTGSPYFPDGKTIPDSNRILGAQLCSWGDYLKHYESTEQACTEEYAIISPRASAMAERLWNGNQAVRTALDVETVYQNIIVPRLSLAAIGQTVRVEAESGAGCFVHRGTFAAIDDTKDTPRTMRYRLAISDTPQATKLRVNYGTVFSGELLVYLKEGESYRAFTSLSFSPSSDWEIFDGFSESATINLPQGSDIVIICNTGSINIDYIEFIYDETRIIEKTAGTVPTLTANTTWLTKLPYADASGSGSDMWSPKIDKGLSSDAFSYEHFNSYIALSSGHYEDSTFVEYNIENAKAESFSALLYVVDGDSVASDNQKLIFSVYADSVPVYVSLPLQPGDAPLPITIDLQGKKTIRLAVRAAEGELSGITGVFADAVFAKQKIYARDYIDNFKTHIVEAEHADADSNFVRIDATGNRNDTNVQGAAIDGVHGGLYLTFSQLPPIETIRFYYASETYGSFFVDIFDTQRNTWVNVGNAVAQSTNAWGWRDTEAGIAILSGLDIAENTRLRITASFSANIDKLELVTRHVEPLSEVWVKPNAYTQIASVQEGTGVGFFVDAEAKGNIRLYVVENEVRYPVESFAVEEGMQYIQSKDFYIPENGTLVWESNVEVYIGAPMLFICEEKAPAYTIALDDKNVTVFKRAYKEQETSMLVAKYDADGRLLCVQHQKVTLAQGENRWTHNIGTGNKIVFFWTSVAALTPIFK